MKGKQRMMNNKERMLAGLLYKSEGEEIIKMKKHGRSLQYQFNQTTPEEVAKRKDILEELLGHAGLHLTIKPPFYCSHGTNIFIGDDCFVNFDCIFLDLNTITLGHHVMIGPRVSIYTAAHPLDAQIRRLDLEYALPVKIGNDVWIGGNVVINPGITIGNNVVIGSGSIVTKDIPDNVIVAGNPAQIVREITDEDSQYWQAQAKEYADDMSK